MQIGNYNIKPIMIHLPDEQFWVDEFEAAKNYFASEGITDIHFIPGIHARKWGVTGRHIYLLDNRPEEQFYIGDNKVGCFLSWYIIYCVMDALPDSHFMILEGDNKFIEGWKPKLEQALKDVPADFDYLFVGSCCAKDKEPVHVKGDVYEFPYRGEAKWDFYPQCGNCYIIAKKAVPTLLATQRDTANPVDISLIKYAFPKLKVYAILPRLSDQGTKTFLPE